MIFSVKNEAGEPLWKLVLEGRKDVTRRPHPVRVGLDMAIQKKRGSKAIARRRVLDCRLHSAWERRLIDHAMGLPNPLLAGKKIASAICGEARREGFASYEVLCGQLEKFYGPDWKTKVYRVEFEKRREVKPCE